MFCTPCRVSASEQGPGFLGELAGQIELLLGLERLALNRVGEWFVGMAGDDVSDKSFDLVKAFRSRVVRP